MIGVTKKRVGNHGETKGSMKYGCVCTCCHADDLRRYQSSEITITLTFLLLPMHYQKDIEKSDRKNSYANHVINN